MDEFDLIKLRLDAAWANLELVRFRAKWQAEYIRLLEAEIDPDRIAEIKKKYADLEVPRRERRR